MQKQKGFTLVELAVVITLVGLLTAVAAPTFAQWRKQSKFESDSQQVISLIADARALALSDKMCDGEPTKRWVARFNSTDTRLFCEQMDGGEYTVSVFPWKSGATIIFEKGQNTTTWTVVTPLDISIFPGGTQSRIGSAYTDKWGKITVDFTEIGKTSTVCFSRIANYPFFSPSGECSEN